MPVYNTSQYKLVATPAAHPFHDQGKPVSNISRQHICVDTETIWTNQSLGSPTIAQVGISSAPSLSFLQSNEHTCQYDCTRARSNNRSVSTDPHAWRACEQRPNVYDQLLSVNNRSFPVTLIFYQISARSLSDAYLFTLLKRVHQPQTIKSGLSLCWKSGTHATVEHDTINRCKQVEKHMCIAPARICRLSGFKVQRPCSPMAWEPLRPAPLGSVLDREM